MTRVAVVGGGVSGLAAAHRLRRELGPRAEIVVFEQAEHLGGKLHTADLAGCDLDLGAEAFLVRRPEVLDLAAELGVRDEVVHPSGASSHIRVDGQVRSIPRTTVLGVPTSAESVEEVLSPAGVDAVRAEAELPALKWDGTDRSVGGLLRARLGDEVVDRLVDPLLGGVYAGGADGLGVRATMPALAAAFDAGARSVTGAAAAVAGSNVGGGGRPGPVFGAFQQGYQRLVARLRAAAAATTCPGRAVRSLYRARTGWQLHVGSAASPVEVDVDGVVLAVPAPAARRLLGHVAPETAERLAAVTLASMIVVGLALPPGTSLPDASGQLIARGEQHADGTPFTAKAFTFSSSKWPHLRGSAGQPLLRASVGRAADAHQPRPRDEELLRAVRADLAEVTGVRAEPVASRVVRWGGGIPQYGVGHAELISDVQQGVAKLPGVEIAGAFLAGVGVPACVSTGEAAARGVLDVVGERRPR